MLQCTDAPDARAGLMKARIKITLKDDLSASGWFEAAMIRTSTEICF